MGVFESIAGVKNTEVVDVLYITLTKIKTYMELIREKVESVECFGLGFGNRRDVRRSRKGLISRECSAGVLDDDPFLALVGCRLVM